MRLPRPLSRLVTLAASAALGASLLSPVSPAAAQNITDGMSDIDTAPTTSDLLWANPEARSADPASGVTARVTAQSAVRATPDDGLEVTVAVTNGSDQPLSGLELRAQHADPVGAPDGVATSLLANQGEYPWVGPFVSLGLTLGPGESRDITVRVPVGLPETWDQGTTTAPVDDVTLPGLGISGPGVHPLLFNLNGNLGDADTSYLAGARTTLTVDEPETAPETAPETDPDTTPDTTPGLTVLWPLSSASVAVAGQVGDAPDPAELYLPDETLAGELSAGGRLRGLLDTWRSATTGADGRAVREASCLAVDPDLLETVERMTHGYTVSGTVPTPIEEPTRLRDRWERHDAGGPSENGTGADAASAWLDDLRDLVQDACVVPLPYANADINAVAAGGDPWLAEEMTDRGAAVVEDVLDVTPATGVQIPGSGYLESDALPVLGGAGKTAPPTAVVADSTLGVPDGTEGTASARSATGALQGSPVRTLAFPAALGAALAATGDRPETVAYTDVSSRRDLAADGAASRMAAAVGVLDLELEAARSTTGQVLAVPPAAWSVDQADAAIFLDAVRTRLTDGSAEPVTFGAALSAPASPVTLDGTTVTSDPAPVDDGAARNVAQVAGHLRNLTNIMEDVPNIALTRRIFTRPMFDDLLRAMSDTGRRVRSEAPAVRDRGAERTGLVTGLAYALRTSVTLLPPGNVFTRTSDSSPLIVVARNGLPLPVSVRVHYAGAPGVTLNTPGVQQIPAQGSVTLQMTSSIPTEAEQSDLTMYLSTPDDVRISDEVTIRLASVPGLNWRLVGVVGACLALIFVAGRTLRKRRRAGDGSPTGRRLQDDGARD